MNKTVIRWKLVALDEGKTATVQSNEVTALAVARAARGMRDARGDILSDSPNLSMQLLLGKIHSAIISIRRF